MRCVNIILFFNLKSKYSCLILFPPILRAVSNMSKVRSLVSGRDGTESKSLDLGAGPFAGTLH